MTKAKGSRKTSAAKKASSRIGKAEYRESLRPCKVDWDGTAHFGDGSARHGLGGVLHQGNASDGCGGGHLLQKLVDVQRAAF